MQDRLPVGGGNLVWIISASEVMHALVLLLGAHKPGSPVEVEMPGRPKSLAKGTGIIRNSNANVDSILTPSGNSAEKISLIFWLGTIDLRRTIDALRRLGTRLRARRSEGEQRDP